MKLTKTENTARKYGSYSYAFEDGAKYMLKRVEEYLNNNLPYMVLYKGSPKEMTTIDFVAKLVEAMEE